MGEGGVGNEGGVGKKGGVGKEEGRDREGFYVSWSLYFTLIQFSVR